MKQLKRLLLTSLFIMCSSAQAGTFADMSIIDRSSGKELKLWKHNGKLYVAGKPNNRYAVKMRNRSGGRVLTILSVDGVNAITGENAAGNQSGYVLDSGETTQILGWRKSESDVAAFYFTSLSDSYASRTGRPGNVGVIGLAVFREYVEPKPVPRVYEQHSSINDESISYEKSGSEAMREVSPAAAQAPSPMKRKEKLGTGHGERIASSISYTEFRRASEYPAEVISIYYDSRENLIAQGIIPSRKPVRPSPQPFPGGFVPDPIH